MPLWSPEQWNGIGVVTLVLLMAAYFTWALLSGRIVLGRYHREIVSIKDDEITQLRTRGMHDANAIDTLSKSLVDKNAAEDATTKILAAFNKAVAGGGR